jgi:hypothetical protein
VALRSGALSAFFREAMAKLPPAPRFDRFAVRDLRALASVERRDASGDLGHGLPLALLGIPVVIDENMEVGVIELRNGDEIVHRLLLSELRA